MVCIKPATIQVDPVVSVIQWELRALSRLAPLPAPTFSSGYRHLLETVTLILPFTLLGQTT